MASIEQQAKAKLIRYFVNGEEQATERHKLTVRDILTGAGMNPPTDYRLVRDTGNKAYTDYEEELPLNDGERFTALFQAPTPTS